VPEGTHAGVVVAVDGGERGVPIGIVEGQRLGHVVSSGLELAAREPSGPQRMMRLDQETRIGRGPSQGEEARRELVGPVDFAAAPSEQEEAPDDREELRGVADLLTELLRPRVGVLDLGGTATLHGHERPSERDLQRDLLLGSLGRLRLAA
jgi:hypothetical protein